MNVIAWVGLGAFATGWTYLSQTRESDDQLLLLSGLIGGFAWLLFAFFALSVTESSSGVTTVFRYPAMAAFAVGMAAPNFYVALRGPLEIVKNRGRLREEVS